MIDVLVTVRFDDRQLARLRAVSPRLSIRREEAGKADYSGAEILYARAPPRELERAPGLHALDNVILSPHVSGFLPSYDERCSELFAENLRRYLDGAPLLNLADRARGY